LPSLGGNRINTPASVETAPPPSRDADDDRDAEISVVFDD